MSRHRSPDPRARPALKGSATLRIIVVSAIGTAVLVGAGVSAAYLFSGEPAPGPRDAVDAWMTAVKAGDAPTMRSLTCAARSEAGSAEIDGEQATSAAWSITAENLAGDSASVTADVTYTVEGFLQRDTWTFDMVHEAQAWKVCEVRPELTSPDTPRTALVDWMSAVAGDDVAAVQSLTCDAQLADITGDKITAVRAQGLDYEITGISKLDENTAQVAFTIQVQRNGGPVRFEERWRFVYEPAEPPAPGHAWKACGPVLD